MPSINIDGAQLYVDNLDPETIAEAREQFRRTKLPDSTPIGDIGRGIARGAVSIPQGITTLGTTAYDFMFDENVTRDVNEYFEELKPEVRGTAGKVAQFITQFGVPGLGTAGLLSKLGKTKALLGAGAVDAAVATDDIETLSDAFLDTELDEVRLAKLNGAEAAAARFQDRLGVFAETAGLMYTIPKVLGVGVKAAGAGLDIAAPMLSPFVAPLARALSNAPNSEIVKASSEANSKIGNLLRENFQYGGRFEQNAFNNKLVADIVEDKGFFLSRLTEENNNVWKSIIKTIGQANKSGNLTDKDALKLTNALDSYKAPLNRIEDTMPGLNGPAKRTAADKLQKESLETIKSFEGVGNKIDYDVIGVTDPKLHLSSLAEDNRGLFTALEEEVSQLSVKGDDAFVKLFIGDDMQKTIVDNQALYRTRAYKAHLDPNYPVDPKFRKDAIEAIGSKLNVDENVAEDAFEELRSLSQGIGKSSYGFDTPKFNIEGIKFGTLKGRTLTDLPEVRKALGEVTAYGEKDWVKALENTALASSVTMSKLGTLVSKANMYKEVRILNDQVKGKLNGTAFLKTSEDLGGVPLMKDADGKLVPKNSFNAPDGIRYEKFSKEAGALEGLYAPEVFVNALMRSQKDYLAEAPALIRNTIKGMFALKSGSQYGKTILSPTTQVRNATSIPFISLLSGNLGPSGKYADTFKKVFAGFFDPKKRVGMRDEIGEAVEYGIIQRGGAVFDEIKELGRYATEDSQIIQQASRSKLGKATGKVLDPFEKAYVGFDDAARMPVWNGEQAKLLNAIKNSGDNYIPVTAPKTFRAFADLIESTPTGPAVKASALTGDALDRFVKSEAAGLALDFVPTYSRVSEIVKKLKYIPLIGNFTAFPAEIIRNTGNVIGRSITELASSNPEMQKIGSRRLASAFTATVGLPVGLQKTALALTGADEEDIKAYQRSFAAPWEKNATLIPVGTDANGKITGFYNFSYTNPYDYLQRPVKALMAASAKGIKDEKALERIAMEATGEAFEELFSPFYEPSIGFQTILDTYTGETPTGKKVFYESDPLGERMTKSFVHIVDTILPTITPFKINVDPGTKNPFGIKLTPKNFPKAISASVFGSTDGKGEDKIFGSNGKRLDVAETMVQAFSGLKVVKPQIDRALYYQGVAANTAIRDSSNEYNRMFRSGGERQAQEFVNGYINSNQQRFESLRDLYTAIEDARQLGASEFDIDTQLKKAKVADRELVMSGVFKPSEVPVELASQAMSGGFDGPSQDVPIRSLFGVADQVAGQTLQGKFIEKTPNFSGSNLTAAEVLREEERKKLLGTP